ncbi:carbohydrate ABC transporter permease [Actinomadura rudentiformis]|uniref:Sugar ABC transporter permease n=1 Tax=Actinomadura rudentiformis TaxID=359158 RepID=A0A6H9YQ87_9ACTN|nr:sugar ABC transporter permease [Actinomadura rudentiformis]KAB2350094.1 sugar ABC transporter permease [Actinomadura rudentiformis]
MATPALIGLIVFVAAPFVLAIWLSLHHVKLGSPRPPNFLELEQYRRILLDPQFAGQFRRALINNGVFAGVVVPVQTALALGLALILNRPLRAMPLFRTFVFMPVVFPMALVAVVWRLIYDRAPDGVLNDLLSVLTFGHLTAHDWLGDPATALPAIMLLSIWQGVGFQMVIILAGLQSIPAELYEAAQMDGAGRWQRFRVVTLPGLRNTLIFVVMVTTMLSFRLFDQVYILTQGGPGNSTTTAMYEAVSTTFDGGDVGRAAAMTVVLFVIVLALTILQRRVLREDRVIQ